MIAEEMLKNNVKDNELKCVIRNRHENKYHSNFRHGYLIGNHPFFGFVDGKLTYVSIDGVYMEREFTEDVVMSFIELDEITKKYKPCFIDKASASNRDTETAQIISDNRFVNMRIGDDRFMFLMYYIRKKCDNRSDFKNVFPVKNKNLSLSTRTVYLTQSLSEQIDAKLDKLNEKRRG